MASGEPVPAPIPPPARGQSHVWLRGLAMAAITLVIAAGVVLVGADFVRRQGLPTPTGTAGPSPTTAGSPSGSPGASPVETPAPSPTAAPTSVPVAQRWNVERIDVQALPFGISAAAVSGARLVAIGRSNCEPESAPTECWVNVFTSDDNARSWVAAPRSDALAIGILVPPSGPEPGMLDIAGGPEGFLAIGYDRAFRPAFWTSTDGRQWSVATGGGSFDRSRVRTVAATGTGWVVGGEVFGDDEPRAAIWTSPDGAAWTRVPDGPAFDIGGYLDTGEEPGTGGIFDILGQGSTTIAVGRSCNATGQGCEPAVWRSTGGPWSRVPIDGPPFVGVLRSVAPFGAAIIATGMQECAPAPCSDEDLVGVVLRSGDGATWTQREIAVTAGTFGIGALAATSGYLVGVVEGPQGPPGELVLAGSVDGDTWEVLPNVPPLGLSGIRAVGFTATPDGSILVVGWGDVPGDQLSFTSFMLLVTRVPA